MRLLPQMGGRDPWLPRPLAEVSHRVKEAWPWPGSRKIQSVPILVSAIVQGLRTCRL